MSYGVLDGTRLDLIFEMNRHHQCLFPFPTALAHTTQYPDSVLPSPTASFDEYHRGTFLKV